MLEITVRKPGHRSCILTQLGESIVVATDPFGHRCADSEPPWQHQAALTPAEHPGMARRSSMRPELVRDAGREPMFIVDSSTTGGSPKPIDET
jgi:hypothetical protein